MNTLGEMLAHPHTQSSGMIFDYETEGEPLKGVAQPLRFNDVRLGPRERPPLRGQQAGDVLREAGYSDEEIEALAASGVVEIR